MRDAILVARVIAAAFGRAAAQQNAGITVAGRVIAIDDRVARRTEQPDPVCRVVRGAGGRDRSVVRVIEPYAALLILRGAEIEQPNPGAVPHDDACHSVVAGLEAAGDAVLGAIEENARGPV